MPNTTIVAGTHQSGLSPSFPRAHGSTFVIEEWSGSGPPFLHIHHRDDEAWHVLEGSLTFQFGDQTVEAVAGTTVFVPAGQPHTYWEAQGGARYLVIMTPRLHQLVTALHTADGKNVDEIMQEHASEIVRHPVRFSSIASPSE